MKNGLEIVKKSFKELRKIYSLEFIDSDEKLLIIGKDQEKTQKGLKVITWDLFNTGKVDDITPPDNFLTRKNLGNHLTRTLGNLLQVDDKGKVMSILNKVEEKVEEKNELERNQSGKVVYVPYHGKTGKTGKTDETDETDEFNNRARTIMYDENLHRNFKPIVFEEEPWVIDNYERKSYCLYHSEVETLQLTVGRSTVQIWHQYHRDPKDKKQKKKDDDKDFIPNKGKPFLEYIWTNGVSADKENDKPLIENFENKRSNDVNDKLGDFCLKIRWCEDGEATIRKQDIMKKVNIVKHACEALEHLNERYKKTYLVNNYIRVRQVSLF